MTVMTRDNYRLELLAVLAELQQQQADAIAKLTQLREEHRTVRANPDPKMRLVEDALFAMRREAADLLRRNEDQCRQIVGTLDELRSINV